MRNTERLTGITEAGITGIRECNERISTKVKDLVDVVHIWETGGRYNVQECDKGDGN